MISTKSIAVTANALVAGQSGSCRLYMTIILAGIGSAGITSGLLVIRPESSIGSKRAIVLPKRRTCCFPKEGLASFLLKTKMAVL
jgi:hypothetical protein